VDWFAREYQGTFNQFGTVHPANAEVLSCIAVETATATPIIATTTTMTTTATLITGYVRGGLSCPAGSTRVQLEECMSLKGKGQMVDGETIDKSWAHEECIESSVPGTGCWMIGNFLLVSTKPNCSIAAASVRDRDCWEEPCKRSVDPSRRVLCKR